MQIVSSARAASDTRHRIDAANSQPRRIKLVGLQHSGARLVREIDTSNMRAVQVLTPESSAIALPELSGAEMIFMVACSGDDLTLAPLIKQIARKESVMVTGILVQSNSAQAELQVLRAASDMLIVAIDSSYVTDMLAQLGA